MNAQKSELRAAIREVLDTEADELLDPKTRESLTEAIVDRCQQDFDVTDDEDADDDEEVEIDSSYDDEA